jgi:hypothetical protein
MPIIFILSSTLCLEQSSKVKSAKNHGQIDLHHAIDMLVVPQIHYVQAGHLVWGRAHFNALVKHDALKGQVVKG